MSLKEQINQDIKKAMLEKKKDELTALRAIKSAILLAESEKGASEGDISEEAELKLLTKAAKQRKESADLYEKEGRKDLAEKELLEYEVISRYLPKQLTQDELEVEVKQIITEVGASGPQDMGKVMGVATKKLAGKAEGKAISGTVKNLLAK
ncbi:GatB/YqeY domain-containing protein [Fulvivirga sp. RKSG066]|uniref:GatB/YqeY domain-containing protein n=1 Tax=Fulvivirga aurantia TaxID=2529383 RepID=UPI0012BBDCAA|nr:GatB/YqeY domain-containing protein [Fulvivirga aurantia]MTI20261.1 GatB/YqeY domain-containing protein [Fulvivirga aurantia]